ncbi:hypothetical protein [uncultured Brevundimonas sp.]|uniref:hypothetical protein n=1 Tax=uncultured Brevundimonas sp. TaxID=213418 RepID=UPI002628DDAA|nr:hypothetical protein [uncultured Brevundimonas sp.]
MTTPLERLNSGYYNSEPVSDANPGGFGDGGHVVNFPAALTDLALVAAMVGQDTGTVLAQLLTLTDLAAAAAASAALAGQQTAAGAAARDAAIAARDLAQTYRDETLQLRNEAQVIVGGDFLTPFGNLSELDDTAVARANLSVWSRNEIGSVGADFAALVVWPPDGGGTDPDPSIPLVFRALFAGVI